MKRPEISTCLLLIAAALAAASNAVGADPPNVVLVMADDQGWGEMGYNGHPHVKTPNFDELAKQAIRFDRFYAAAPVCSPTRGSVMTGRTPNRFGCFSWGHTLRPQEITIAEALQQAGYRTGHFGKWHLGSVQRSSPVCPGASGFDTWVSAPNFFDLNPILSDEGKAVPFIGDSSEVTVDVALEFIRECARKRERFLAVVWFGSPHSPHQPLETDAALYANLPQADRRFLAEITAMDRAFGRLRSELAELELKDNTLLWYCSDNGALPKVGSPGNRRGLKGSIYEGGLAVPALLEYPARFKSPQIISMPCVTSDIYPTVLELAGVEVTKQPPLDGISLVPTLDGDIRERPQAIGFWAYPARGFRTPSKEWMEDLLADQQKGIEPTDPDRIRPNAGKIDEMLPLDRFAGHSAWLDGTWKLHRIENANRDKVVWELYNLAEDPQEQRNLVSTHPEKTEAMQSGLQAWLKSVAQSYNGEDYGTR